MYECENGVWKFMKNGRASLWKCIWVRGFDRNAVVLDYFSAWNSTPIAFAWNVFPRHDIAWMCKKLFMSESPS